eukprot:scaffold11527_cov105-Skeletonema_dohrnii-CCMP3373.AAC.5
MMALISRASITSPQPVHVVVSEGERARATVASEKGGVSGKLQQFGGNDHPTNNKAPTHNCAPPKIQAEHLLGI